jgi:membrane protein DedA with SNARE-associated domain/rhodanese-related sulfurtransferase
LHHTLEFLIRYGASLLFAVVLAEQLGLPIPAEPVLLAMGTLIGLGRYSLAPSAVLSLTASVLADTVWFGIGQRRGQSVLKLLCRVSLEPDSCVSGTRFWFRRLGAWVLVIAKFFPGLSTIAPPMAGFSRMPWWKFLIADTAGSALWTGTFLGAGFVFRLQLEEVGDILARLGSGLVSMVGCLLALWIGYKYWQRRRFMRSLRMARLTPEELKDHLGEYVILDLRTPDEVEWDGKKLPGAIWMDRRKLEERSKEIPRDREVALYCSCPNEVTSARAALQLRELGITRVRPLEGGYDAWRELGYAVEDAGDVAAK